MLEIGQRVRFKPHLYEDTWGKYYELYRGHEFKVIGYLTEDEQVFHDAVYIECVTGDVIRTHSVNAIDLEPV